MIAPLLALPFARLTRTPRGWLPILAWVAIAILAATVERSSAHAADHVLLGTFGAVALPLLAYGVVGAVLGGSGLSRACAPLVSFGATPARVALGATAVSAGATALLAGLLGAIVAGVAHGALSANVARDVVITARVAALGGIAYAALFTLGATFGKRGGGRSFALVLDWILGAGTGFGSVFTPRGHLRSLLGGDATMGLSEPESLVAIVLLAVAFTAAIVQRADR